MKQDLLRQLPQVEKALQWPEVESLVAVHSRVEVIRALRGTLEDLRERILADEVEVGREEELFSPLALSKHLERRLVERSRSSYRRVINGTGVILHTGLGRAVLAPAALDSLQDNLRGYSLVEIDVESGQRGKRDVPLRSLLSELTGAPSATVVNNNAAATLLSLASFARGKEVVISRGQLVEIGGSFRIPDILRESGARLVEVGTTNRTHLEDYRRAITPETGLLLEVHASNYEIRGFTAQVALEDLVALGRQHGIPVMSDLGSGCFLDLSPYGFRREPLVGETVATGVDLVCFSGDKLLGGPQAGIILGGEEAVERVRAHPLFRTLRVDKITLCLLEASLRLYLDAERALEEVPALRALSAGADEIKGRVVRFAERFRSPGVTELEVEPAESATEMGSGSLPAQQIPSWALAVRHRSLSPEKLAAYLRAASPPIFGRRHEDRVLLDFRTVLPVDEADLDRVLGELAGGAIR